MRIRKRPQIPVPLPDLPPPVPAQVGAAATTTAPTSAASAAAAVGGNGEEGLHPTDGDPPLIKPPHGCTTYQTPAAGRDPARSGCDLGRRTAHVKRGGYIVDGPNSGHSSSGEVLVLEGEREAPAVDDAHKIWSGDAANCSGNNSSSSAARAPVPDQYAAGRSSWPGGKSCGVLASRGKKGVVGKEEKKGKKSTARVDIYGSSTTTAVVNNGGGGVTTTGTNGIGDGEGSSTVVMSKRRRSPAVLMEGSRCSRVNGRGWRCCQQTLVGYSLCEHHLGKGRLRSVVKCNGAANYNGITDQNGAAAKRKLGVVMNGRIKQAEKSTPVDDQEDEEDPVGEIKPLARRRKIGMVKARSISSLLDETNQAHGVSTVTDHINYGRRDSVEDTKPLQVINGVSSATCMSSML